MPKERRTAAKKAPTHDMVTRADIDEVLSKIDEIISKYRSTTLKTVAEETDSDPFLILISCIISLRTKDQVTAQASQRLFGRANTPAGIASLAEEEIQQLIYPAGFYRNKAKQIREISRDLEEKHNSRVPNTIEELLQFRGVG